MAGTDCGAEQLTSLTDRNGRLRTFGYDNAGRQTSELWKDGSGNTIRTISYTFDAVGQMTGATDPDSTYAYTYDTAGRLTRVDNQGTPSMPRVIFNYTWDPFNHLIQTNEQSRLSVRRVGCQRVGWRVGYQAGRVSQAGRVTGG